MKHIDYEDKSPEEIEKEIDQTRAEMSYTLRTLERKLSPGDLADQALDYFRQAGEGPNEFAVNLGRSIKHNPIPVTLLGVGLGWLMLAGSERPERHYSRTSSRSKERFHYGEPAVIPSAGTDTSTKTPSGASATSSGESGGRRKEQARQTAHEAREWAEHMAHDAREQMGEASEAAHYQAERARQGFTYMLREQPLVLGAIGVALGAALGAALPPTRKEDAWMGRKRDEVLEHAEAVGKEELHKAEQVAEAAQEAAKEEAERQNLAPSQVKQKAGRVTETAQEAAKREAKR